MRTALHRDTYEVLDAVAYEKGNRPGNTPS